MIFFYAWLCIKLLLNLKILFVICIKGPADYALPGTVGSGPGASIKGRHDDPEGDDGPGAAAYNLNSTFGVDGAGVSMKGRYKDKDGNGQPGVCFLKEKEMVR